MLQRNLSSHIIEKLLLESAVALYAQLFNPLNIVSDTSSTRKYFDLLPQKLMALKNFSASEISEQAKQQFRLY